MKRTTKAFAFISSMAFCAALHAGTADVLKVEIEHSGGNSYRFSVTVEHADSGWKHYADAWEVLDAEGNELGKRVLLHPHVDEQPFTRSLSGVEIPEAVNEVTVRAHDSVHGYGGAEVKVEVPR